MKAARIERYLPTIKDIRLKYDEILTDEEKLALSRVYNHLKIQLAREETKDEFNKRA